MTEKIFKETVSILREFCELISFGDKIYLVGGCVRDIILEKVPKDIDLCIDYPNGVKLFIEYLKENESKRCYGFVEYNRFNTAKFSLILSDNSTVDIECVIPREEEYNAGPRKPSITKQTSLDVDAFRRDFCCNSIYKNILTGDIIDPTGNGVLDCKNKILRTPLEPIKTFIDDPLRMLRAIRFSCTKDFKIEDDTEKNIKYYPEYDKLSIERIRDEFIKILMSDNPIKGIKSLVKSGLIMRIIPELKIYECFEQNSKYHNLNWIDHTFSVLEKIVKYNKDSNLELRLSGLLHDISKPTCFQIKPDGTYSYHLHDIKSSELAVSILTKLKFPNKIIDKVEFLIKNHMILKQFYNYSTKEYTGNNKITRKIVRLLGDNIEDELQLIEADNMSHSPNWCMVGQIDSFRDKIEELKNISEDNSYYNQLTIDGNFIINKLNCSPGKLIGDIKSILQEYLDSDNSLTDEQLWELYIDDYNRSIFIVYDTNDIDKINVYLKKPIKNKYGWIGENNEIPMIVPTSYIDEKNIFLERNEINVVSSLMCPNILKLKLEEDFLNKTIDNVKLELSKLSKIKRFNNIKIMYDNDFTISLDLGNVVKIL